MKDPERHELLKDLFSAEGAPGVETVIAGLRRDQALRQRRRTIGLASAITLCAVLAISAPWLRDARRIQTIPTSAVSIPPNKPGSSAIQRLTDAELQASIDRPSAIVTLPDGRKSLLVLMPPKLSGRGRE